MNEKSSQLFKLAHIFNSFLFPVKSNQMTTFFNSQQNSTILPLDFTG